MKLAKRFLRQLPGMRVYVGIAIFLGIVAAIFIIIQAFALSQIIERVFLGKQALGQVWLLMLLFAGVIGARAVLAWGRELAANGIAGRIKLWLRARLLSQLYALGPAFTRGERSGELISTLIEGIDALDPYFGQYLPQAILAVLVPILILIVIFMVDVPSGIILLIMMPILPFLMAIAGLMARAETQRHWKALRLMGAHFLDVLQGLTTLKLFGHSQEEEAQIRQVSEQLRSTTMGTLRIAFFSSLVLEEGATISAAMIAVTIGFRILIGQIALQPALFVLLLAPEFFLPLRLLGAKYHAGMTGSAALERIMELLETPVPASLTVQSDGAHIYPGESSKSGIFCRRRQAPSLHSGIFCRRRQAPSLHSGIFCRRRQAPSLHSGKPKASFGFLGKPARRAGELELASSSPECRDGACLRLGQPLGQPIDQSLGGPIDQSLGQPLDGPSGQPLSQPITAPIRFEQIDYTYDGQRPALHQVSFQILPGQKVALVGPTGAGKSTIAHLLLRFIAADCGQICVDGRNLAEIPAQAWRSQVAWVPQHPYLFNATVAENICLGCPQATLAEVQEAAQLAHAHRFISALPQGYETIIGERGSRLSGGEAQRLSLARAFLKGAPLLILDEATAHLDPDYETEVLAALTRLQQGRTVLIIAHRLRTVYDADAIIVVDGGRIIASGTHKQLLRQSAFYERLITAYQGKRV